MRDIASSSYSAGDRMLIWSSGLKKITKLCLDRTRLFVWLDVAPVITFNCICGPQWSFNPTLSGKPDKRRRPLWEWMMAVTVPSPGSWDGFSLKYLQSNLWDILLSSPTVSVSRNQPPPPGRGTGLYLTVGLESSQLWAVAERGRADGTSCPPGQTRAAPRGKIESHGATKGKFEFLASKLTIRWQFPLPSTAGQGWVASGPVAASIWASSSLGDERAEPRVGGGWQWRLVRWFPDWWDLVGPGPGYFPWTNSRDNWVRPDRSSPSLLLNLSLHLWRCFPSLDCRVTLSNSLVRLFAGQQDMVRSRTLYWLEVAELSYFPGLRSPHWPE